MDYFTKLLNGHMFLCSRDIKLGDTYYHDSFHPYPDHGDVADTNSKVMTAHMMVTNEGSGYDGDWSYVVVGAIHPRLDWVKEGMDLSKYVFKIHDCGMHMDCCETNCPYDWKGGNIIEVIKKIIL